MITYPYLDVTAALSNHCYENGNPAIIRLRNIQSMIQAINEGSVCYWSTVPYNVHLVGTPTKIYPYRHVSKRVKGPAWATTR